MGQSSTGHLKSKVIVAKAIPVLLAVSAIYGQELAMVIKEALATEMMSHIIAVPFIFAYLLYRKRRVLEAAISIRRQTKERSIQIREVVGVLLCVTAFILYWHGSYAFNPLEYRIISLPIFVVGLLIAIFNLETARTLAFPIFFLVFMTPPPLELFTLLGIHLSTISSEIAYNFLRIIGLPVDLTTEYGAPVIVVVLQSGTRIPFAIDLACSGMYSLTGFTVFSAFIAYMSQGTLSKKALVFIIGFPLIYLLNIVRIISVILLGYNFGPELATQAFHLLGGLILTFTGVLLLLVILEKAFKLQFFTSRATESSHSCLVDEGSGNMHFCIECGRILRNSWPKITRRDMAKALLLISLASLTIPIHVPAFALVKGPEEITLEAESENLVGILPEIQEYSLSFIYRDEEFEKLAKQDASLIFLYKPQKRSDLAVWVGLEIAETRAVLHRWEVCLITWPETHGRQTAVTVLDQRDVNLLDNPPIFGRYIAVQWKKTGELQVILYWYETLVFRVLSGYQPKNVKISVVAYGNNPEEYTNIEDELLLFGKAIVRHLQPLKLWSTFALATSQYGAHLLAVSISSFATLLALQAANGYDRRKKNLRIYHRLDPEDKLIINAMKQSSQPTLTDIATRYERLNGKPLKSRELLEKLRKAEEIGLVRSCLASRRDEPVLIWKSEVLM